MLNRRLMALFRSSDGTWMIAVGAIGASLGAYGFQVVGGRTLGAAGFGPVAALWTTGFLIYTIVMLPVEQMITRSVTLAGGATIARDTRRQVAMTLGAGFVVGTGIAALAIDRFFEGEALFVAVMALLMLSRALMTVARGVMAGRQRFWAYGTTMLLEAVALLTLGVVFSVADAAAVWFAAAIAAAPLALLLVRPYQIGDHHREKSPTVPESSEALQLLVVAAALSQLILAGGPLVVGLVGGTAAQVSIYFITFTLLRGPITASYGLATRFLAAMTTAITDNKEQVLHLWSIRLAVLGAGLATLSGLASYFILPSLIEILYGAEFRPSATVAALGGAGAVAALSILFVSQILIAKGHTRDLAIGWLAAALVASVALWISDSEPLLRVATAFAVGELAAFAAIAATAMRRSVPQPVQV